VRYDLCGALGPEEVIRNGDRVVNVEGKVLCFTDAGDIQLGLSGTPVLQSLGLSGSSAKLVMQADGNLVYYDANLTPKWAFNNDLGSSPSGCADSTSCFLEFVLSSACHNGHTAGKTCAGAKMCSPPSPPYAQASLGDADCPTDYAHITSSADCEAAATALGLCDSSKWTGRTNGIPVGCSHRPNHCGQDDLHFNTVTAGGSGRSDLRPICRLASYFTVVGPCTVDGACARSPNYPSEYGDHQSCAITPTSLVVGQLLSATAFNTEGSYDELIVNGAPYSGTTGPSNALLGSASFTWYSDHSSTRAGWEVCAH